MNSRRTVIVAGIPLLLGVLALLFLSLDFHATQSSSGTRSEVAKYTAGLPHGVKAQPPRELGLYVVGEDRLALSLKRELARRLGAGLGSPRVTVLDAPPEQASQPVLIVQVTDRDVKWTPVYARAAVSARFTYASDGDMSWRDEFTVVMNLMGGEPQIRVRGDLGVADTSRGVVSEPAYQRLLAQRIAAAVSEALQKQLSG